MLFRSFVRPRFVTAAMREGEVVQEFPTETIREQICSPSALNKIQTMLSMVVSDGLGKKAGNPTFPVAGKTGTAQISQGAGGYKSGITHYLISFCGYFPANNPKYSCIVAIQKSGLPASGGGQCGPVFSEISQAIMAKATNSIQYAEAAVDTVNHKLPLVKKGKLSSADYVLGELNVARTTKEKVSSNDMWGVANIEQGQVHLNRIEVAENLVPNVVGMGAKDALYLLESRGLKVRLNGVGKVVSQSVSSGQKISKGATVMLTLRHV